NGCRKKAACRRVCSTKHELCSVVEEPQAQERRSDEVELARVAHQGWRQAQRYQRQERQQGLQIHNSNSGATVMRQHQEASAVIIFTVHPGDGHEVRKLPQEKQSVERQSLDVQFAGYCGPSYERGHGPRKGPNQSAQWRLSFERGVDK